MNPPSELPIVLSDLDLTTHAAGQCDCNCDCACSLAPAAVTQLTPIVDAVLAGACAVRLAHPSRQFTLDSDHAVVYGPAHRLAVVNRPAQTVLAYYSQRTRDFVLQQTWLRQWGEGHVQALLKQLLAIGLLTSDGCDLPLVAGAHTLVAWLHVTDRCNLRCTYCYLPHLPADMSLETGRAAIDATFRSALANGYTQVKFKYAGGEALLRLPLIADLHRYAQAQANQHRMQVDGVILSNGTLLSKRAVEIIQAMGLRLMISLDGLGDLHDRQRPFAGGGGSSTAVTQAIELALARGLTPELSITISSANIDGLPALLDWILTRKLRFNLNFYRENDCSTSMPALNQDEDRIIAGMLAAYKVIEARMPNYSLLASLGDLTNLSTARQYTCGVGRHYLVFDQTGAVAKCQMQMQQTVTNSDDSDPLARVRADRRGIQNPAVAQKSECAACEWNDWCTGGCPLAAFRAHGRYDAKSPNCNIYRALYPAVIRLEGLRLLSQHAS